jgi:urease accessory protein
VFLVGFGMLLARSALSSRRGFGAIAAFVAASSVGVVAQSVLALGAAIDVLVALTLVLLAAALSFARSLRGARFGAAALAAGAAHGLAFGEAVIGAEPTPIAFYLVGLALIETAIAWCAMLGARYVQRRAPRVLQAATRFAAIAAAASGAWIIAAVRLS